MPPMWMSVDLMRSLDNFTRKAMYIQAQPFVYAADKEKQLELLNERMAAGKKDREEWLAARAAETELTKAEREKINEQLKFIKAEREKEKLEKKQAQKQQKLLEKERAAVEKEEKRVQAIEELMMKREQQKEKAIEQAKKRAEQRAEAELKREQQAREREEKVKRSILERAEREKARREIAELTKQVYEERRKELALEAEVKRREKEEIEAAARREAELKAAKIRSEREAYEKGMRDFRLAAIKVEAERRLEEIAERRRLREAELAMETVSPPRVDPIKDMATAAWAASQAAHNPRLAAGHPNANPLQSVYVEDDDEEPIHQKPSRPQRDPALSQQVNNTLLRLVQDAKDRLEVEKNQASKNATPATAQHPLQGGRGRAPPQEGSVRPAHGREQFQDSPLFAQEDDESDDENDGNDDEHANYLQEEQHLSTDSDDERSETSSIAYVARSKRISRSHGNHRRDASVEDYQTGPAKRRKSTAASASRLFPSPAKQYVEIETPLVLNLLRRSKECVKQKNNTFAIKCHRDGHAMYLTPMCDVPGCTISRLGNAISVVHNQRLQDLEGSPGQAEFHTACGVRAIRALARKAHDAGYNALVKLKAYDPSGTPKRQFATCFVSGIPAVITSEGKDAIRGPTGPRPEHARKHDIPPKQKAQPPKDQRHDRKGQRRQPDKLEERRSQRPKYLEDFYH